MIIYYNLYLRSNIYLFLDVSLFCIIIIDFLSTLRGKFSMFFHSNSFPTVSGKRAVANIAKIKRTAEYASACPIPTDIAIVPAPMMANADTPRPKL